MNFKFLTDEELERKKLETQSFDVNGKVIAAKVDGENKAQARKDGLELHYPNVFPLPSHFFNRQKLQFTVEKANNGYILEHAGDKTVHGAREALVANIRTLITEAFESGDV
jgi:hypothetical protein